ncbi:MAG: bifunctional metallophosphatase/5'-nucleotidase [Desulfobacula sp.]|jgi:5'-nucleotidase / UDP-sugar diphosphatase|uniref:bifunctional metallophosphatase/5'-nucleotidase n=2 Tax=Desulfobacula sp. TaxID=2593537 RepID=UPI002A100AF6|nr:bifunctional metallophosphatase/5'-nucleotidase [Desulfobacula sp.]MBT5545319.1 bifunctional metallophosphatase/5'-nucleotidase [Desulfobacula sp.]MBT7794490.1 bifunctional metallophosphatase/5'-nucleotidase [Desulfobacula sp.]
MPSFMKYFLILVSAFLCFNTANAAKKEISIIHTNDLHSHLLGFSPNQDYTETVLDDDTIGGYARISTMIKQIKKNSKGPVLVLDGGDFLMGSFFHMLSRENAFELALLGKMGYDAATLGNHEFDLKPKGLAQILESAQKHDNLPVILLSNMVFSEESPEDDLLEQAFLKGLIKPYALLEKEGVTFGIFGLMGLDAAEKAPFSKPVSFSDPVAAAQKMVATLKGKADIIICLSHGGLNPNKEKSEDELLARKVTGIDVIISGHTHTKMKAPITINNTLIVQTWEYGKQIGHITLALENQRVGVTGYQSIPIDDRIPGDPEISDLISTYETIIDQEFLKDHGLSFRKTVARTDFDLKIKEEESPLGNFLTDSIRFAVKKYSEDFNPFADVAIISNGVIRDNLLKGKTNTLQACDLFRSLPLGIGLDNSLGYPLISMYITPLELKKGFEILTSIYPAKGPDYFLQIAGAKMIYNPRRIMFDRVTDIWTGDEENGYKRLDFSRSNKTLLRVTADIYNATFLKIIGGYTYNILEIIPKDKNGTPIENLSSAVIDGDKTLGGIQELKEWKAPFEYLASLENKNKDVPELPTKYSKKLGRIISAPSINPVKLVRNGTWLTWAAVGVMALGLCIVLALIGVVVKKFNQ